MPPRGAHRTDESRHGPEDQQRDPVVCRWFCVLHFLTGRAPLPQGVRRQDRRVACRRRLLPADQLHRLRASEQRERPRSCRRSSDRLLAVEDGDLVSPAPPSVRRSMPKVAQAVDSLFAEVRASIENAHALGMYDPVTSLPNRLHFRSEADKLLSDALEGSQFGDAVRRPRPVQERQRQSGPCTRRPAADHGRQPPSCRRQRGIQRQCAAASAARAPRRRRIHDVLPGDRVCRRDRADCAPGRPRHFRALRAVRPQRRYRRIDRRRNFAGSRHQHRGSDARCGYRHVPRQIGRRWAALPVRCQAGGRASGEGRDRKGADRSCTARRLPDRIPAANEPGHR